MFRYPVKFDQYIQDVQKSIDYILKIVRAPKVDKIIAGDLINISPSSGTGDVTISVDMAGLHSGGLYAQTADSIPITGTTLPGNLIDGGVGTLSVPANGFQVGDSFIAYFSGDISCVNNETIHIHCYSDGQVLADTGIVTLNATTNKSWEMFINFTIRTIGPAGIASIATSGRFSYNKNSNNSPESVGFYSLNNTTFDTTVNNILQVTAQWGSANMLNTIYTRVFNLYRIY